MLNATRYMAETISTGQEYISAGLYIKHMRLLIDYLNRRSAS